MLFYQHSIIFKQFDTSYFIITFFQESLFKKIVHKIINDIRRNVEKLSQQKTVTMNNKADEECDIMVFFFYYRFSF